MINVKFSWIDMWKDGSLEPHCSILNINEALNITHFLIDDEGLGISHLQKWIKNGLEEIDKISKNELSRNLSKIKKELDLTNNMAIIPFSSVTKLGKEQVLNEIEKVLED